MSNEGDWTCGCGRANVRVAATCLACGKPRGEASSPDAPTVDGAKAPALDAKTVAASAELKTVVEPVPPAKPAPRPTARRGAGGPKCAACGYENKPAAVVCGLCQAPLHAKAAPEPSPVAAAAAPAPASAAEEARAAESAHAYRDLAAMRAGRVPAAPAIPEVVRARAAAAATLDDPESSRRTTAACGALALGCGLIWAFSGMVVSVALTTRAAPLSSTPAPIGGPADLLRLEKDENVKLGAGTPQWSRSVLRAKTSDKHVFEFFSADPRVAIAVEDTDELFAKRDDLMGCIVQLQKAPPYQSFLWEVKIEYRGKYDRTGTRLENPTRLYCCLSATKNQLWCVSDYFQSETVAAAQDWLKHDRRVGRLLPLDVPPAVQTKWKDNHGSEIPKDALEIYELASEASFSDFEVWAPIEGTGERLWVAYPGDTAPPSTYLQGVYVRAPATRYATRVVPALAPMAGVLRLASLAQDELRDRKAADGAALGGFSPLGLLPLVLGVVMLAAARAQRPASG